jgi:hypothetical protein
MTFLPAKIMRDDAITRVSCITGNEGRRHEFTNSSCWLVVRMPVEILHIPGQWRHLDFRSRLRGSAKPELRLCRRSDRI